ncbi:MAG: rhomboid family intramembrane serine protease [Bdellovibrionota bacterium]|nr:rhomboid family intramembrane serine protease [Bdellovibrionota bacterium]
MLFIPYKLDTIYNKFPFITYSLILICFLCQLLTPMENEVTTWAEKIENYCNEPDNIYLEMKKDQSFKSIIRGVEKNIKEEERSCTASLFNLFLQPHLVFSEKMYDLFDDDKREELMFIVEEFNEEVGPSYINKNTFNPSKFSFLKSIRSAFYHSGWSHLLGNLFFLWLFGRSLEVFLGSKNYLFAIFVGALSSDILYFLSHSMDFVVPHPTLGFSGVVFGLLGLFTACMPRVKVVTFVWRFPDFKIPGFIFTLFWFFEEVFNLFFQKGSSEVNILAHVGGFIGCYLLGRLFYERYEC